MNALVLLSGGVDSAACLAFYKKLTGSVRALFVDYGQPTRSRERESARRVADYFSVSLDIVDCQGPKTEFSGEIPGRNAFLVFTAMLYGPIQAGVIALGIHFGTPYYDCHDRFTTDITRVFEGYTDGRLVLGTPFLSWTKDLIWDYCLENSVPISLTWSCEVGPEVPCGACLSCRDMEALNARTKK